MRKRQKLVPAGADFRFRRPKSDRLLVADLMVWRPGCKAATGAILEIIFTYDFICASGKLKIRLERARIARKPAIVL